MFLLSIFPLTRIPRPASQPLTYFCPQPLKRGSLVLAPLKKRQVKGIVIDCQKPDKLAIKTADFKLKGIDKILSSQKVVTDWQIDLAEYLGEYYWTSPGIFLKMMIGRLKISAYGRPASGGKNEQTLILIPEISQIEKAIKELGLKDHTILHSGLGQKKYYSNWLKIKEGQIKNIIGTRMAVLAPFTKLKKIIILDESNPHHKSWDMSPHYRVHEVAQKLAELHQAEIILKSDIPSIETYYLTKKKGGPGRKVPTQIVDMREELKEGNFSIFSRALQDELQKIIINKTKAILFINRRGAGTFVLCRDCGYVAKCANCDVPLVQHISKKHTDWQLICHHCGYKEKSPNTCPMCKSIRIKAFGTGTQKVELEIKKLFPQIKALRLDADTGSVVEQKADVLITTQMLFSHYNNETIGSRHSVEDPRKIKKSKIFNFSGQWNNVSFIGLISADTILHLPDFRSGEKTFQTIVKLKKIAGPKSLLLIQSYNPTSYVIKYASQNNYMKFYEEEIKARDELGYPPFSQIIKLRFSHSNAQKANQEAKILFAKLTRQIKKRLAMGDMRLLGPSPAFIPKIKGKYIWQILIKYKSPKNNQKKWLENRNKILSLVPSNWQVYVDPETTL